MRAIIAKRMIFSYKIFIHRLANSRSSLEDNSEFIGLSLYKKPYSPLNNRHYVKLQGKHRDILISRYMKWNEHGYTHQAKLNIYDVVQSESFVKIPYYHLSHNLIISILDVRGWYVGFIPNNLITSEYIEIACGSMHVDMRFIPEEFLTTQIIKSSLYCYPYNAEYVPDRFLTTKLIGECISYNPNILDHLPKPWAEIQAGRLTEIQSDQSNEIQHE